MDEKKWTRQQSDFLCAGRGPVIVSAAAGSGKTASLVERVARRLTNRENPLAAENLLMVTFSNAAANEMASRIEAAFVDRLRENPDDRYLSAQAEALAGAQISTIHSFCIKTVRENFHELGIFCDFRVLEQSENNILKSQAADRVIKRAYDSADPMLFSLIELVCDPRSDSVLYEIISAIYDTVIAMPFPKDRLNEWLSRFKADDEGYEYWRRVTTDKALNAAEYAREMCLDCPSLVSREKNLALAQEASLQLEQLCRFLKNGDAQEALAVCSSISLSNGGLQKESDIDAFNEYKARRSHAGTAVKNAAEILSYTGRESFFDDQGRLGAPIKYLFSLVSEFIDEFAFLKREKNGIDYSDAEQFMLTLLYKKEGEHYIRSELAHELSRRYREVYIDEYQDVNAAQEMIFQAITPEDGSIFMIGDVKQSIYGFRQADAGIFNDKRDKFYPYDEKNPHFPAKIYFFDNFRSREPVTDFVNLVFKRLMTAKTGSGEYTERDALKSRAPYPENERAGVSLIFSECESGMSSEERNITEARLIASEIKSIVTSGYRISDGEETRECRYGDFCILSRSDSGFFSTMRDALSEQNISARVDNKENGFFNCREILTAVSLISCINNPFDDISLCAALMSPVFMFTPSDMATIRTSRPRGRDKSLYASLKASAEAGNVKCGDFIAQLLRLRQLAAGQGVDSLLKFIYDRYGLYGMVEAMPNGSVRAGNLDMLRYYARCREKNGYKGLSDFLSFLKRSAEQKNPLKGTSSAGDSDAVSIMTVHASKGLEFPICILAKTTKKFNTEDLNKNYLLSGKHGFSCVIKDEKSAVKTTPLTYYALKAELKDTQLAEEIRVLYVAMTRAREKLIIPIVRTKLAERFDRAIVNSRLSDLSYAVMKADNFADMLLLSAVNSPSMKSVIDKFTSNSNSPDNSVVFEAKCAVVPESDDAGPEEKEPVADQETVRKIKKLAGYVYPYGAQTGITGMVTVSELTKGEKENPFDFSIKPAFMNEHALSGAERGTALHLFMQYADFKMAAIDIEAEIRNVCEKGFLSPEQAEAIDRNKLTKFFSSELFARMGGAKKCLREYKFITGMDSSQFGGDKSANDTVILQGVADCVLIEDNSAVIVDYKTDFVKSAAELSTRYRAQLLLYRDAIEKLLLLPVSDCVIYSFCLGEQISILTHEM